MNWYRKLAQAIEEQTLQEIALLVENGIWRPIVVAKKKLANQFANPALQQLFIQCENAARKIIDLAKNNAFSAAVQMCSNLEGYLSKVCGYIDCNEIRQNAENVRVIVNDLFHRSTVSQMKQPPAQTPQQPQSPSSQMVA